MENTVKSEDKKRKKLEIDPFVLLEVLGIDEFCVSFAKKTVYLCDKESFEKTANYFDMKGDGIAFFACGWLWELDEELKP